MFRPRSLARTDLTAEQLKTEIKALIEKIEQVAITNIIALMRLRERFGPTVVSRALALLSSGNVPVVKPADAARTLDDSKPAGSVGPQAGVEPTTPAPTGG